MNRAQALVTVLRDGASHVKPLGPNVSAYYRPSFTHGGRWAATVVWRTHDGQWIRESWLCTNADLPNDARPL